ncbi:MAG: hypothetical protein V3R90_13365 [Limibaculum sp.]
MHAVLAAALIFGFAGAVKADTLRMSSQWTENTTGAKVDKRRSAEIKKCAKQLVNHAWIAGIVAINGSWVAMTQKLI